MAGLKDQFKYGNEVAGNETTRNDPIWIVAKRFNEQSKQLNGAVTCVRRRECKGYYKVVG